MRGCDRSRSNRVMKRRRVGPKDKRTLADTLWPQRHAKWWGYDTAAGREKSVDELYEQLRTDDENAWPAATWEHVQGIAQTAVDRAAAADRRATTIAGTVAIAASFTLSGAGLVVDPTKIADGTIRLLFTCVLAATTILFITSAIFALRALVSTRQWSWSNPHDLPHDKDEPANKQLGMRAAHLYADFATNWEISDLKNRLVDNALVCLVGALSGIGGLAVLLVINTA